MTERVIPLRPVHSRQVLRSAPAFAAGAELTDTRARPLRDLRISVTDRCNFRCRYCMPRSVFGADYPFLPSDALLSSAEITRMVRAFVALGVEKVRLTGGEPLLRKDIDTLIAALAPLSTRTGQPLELTLTTNGAALKHKARALREAGLRRITVSLDALDEALFQHMIDADFSVRDVLEGIEAAQAAGFAPIKINMVVQRGVNDHEIVPMARRFKGSGHVLRFIEFMDVGNSNAWRLQDVVPAAEVIQRIDALMPLEPLPAQYYGEVAQRWRYRDGDGEIGVVSSISQAFCHDCTRARLSADGQVYLCLFASQGHDFRPLLRDASVDETSLQAALAQVWRERTDRYSELRALNTQHEPRVEMSYIGG